ncbi:hypothetical protein [Catelliglobosispora koreensis]|uniref:hypothetical protein n=1 Tax=Catelliglobosispora koreensis TaxID=129052 RepID=UPI00035E2B1E|nr:hypothetical protein [Catelliglobosispora koreensis]
MTVASCLAAGAVVGGLAVWVAVGWRIEIADWKLRTAQAVRDQADEMLATAEYAQVRADALMTPTALHETVKPPAWARLARWIDARFAPAEQTPDWKPGEVLNLPPSTLAPPLPARTRGLVHPSRRSWPLKQRPAFPTPADVAARLRALADPTLSYRVTRSF